MNTLELAEKAGLGRERWNTDKQLHDFLDRFAALVAAHEREACAKVCETDELCCKCGDECAAAIRARSQTRGDK